MLPGQVKGLEAEPAFGIEGRAPVPGLELDGAHFFAEHDGRDGRCDGVGIPEQGSGCVLVAEGGVGGGVNEAGGALGREGAPGNGDDAQGVVCGGIACGGTDETHAGFVEHGFDGLAQGVGERAGVFWGGF